MKFVIPFSSAPDNFQENVAYTLRALGHEVLMPPPGIARSKYRLGQLFRDFGQKVFPERWTPAERWVTETARDYRPDMVICLTQALHQEILEELKRSGVKKLVAWWGDAPSNMSGLGLLAPGWDAIFLKDRATVLKFQAVGLPAECLPEAMNPVWHRRNFENIKHDVAVAGNYYGYRQYLVTELLKKGVPLSLYGPPPPRWALDSVKNAHQGRYIVKQDKSRIFGEAIACLNSTALSEGDSLNCRAFEIAGACGLQLLEDKPSVSDCFEPGREVLAYRSVEEILEYLDRARREPGWALKIREAGHRRANSEHTYEIRLRHIISRVFE